MQNLYVNLVRAYICGFFEVVSCIFDPWSSGSDGICDRFHGCLYNTRVQFYLVLYFNYLFLKTVENIHEKVNLTTTKNNLIVRFHSVNLVVNLEKVITNKKLVNNLSCKKPLALMLLKGSRNCCCRSFVWFLIISTLQLMLLDMRSMLVEILDTGPLTRAARRRE